MHNSTHSTRLCTGAPNRAIKFWAGAKLYTGGKALLNVPFPPCVCLSVCVDGVHMYLCETLSPQADDGNSCSHLYCSSSEVVVAADQVPVSVCVCRSCSHINRERYATRICPPHTHYMHTHMAQRSSIASAHKSIYDSCGCRKLSQ